MNELIKKEIYAPATAEKFALVVSAARGLDIEKARCVYQVESLNFLKMLSENTNIPENVTPVSVQGAFLEVVSNGLSFSRTSDQVYLTTKSIKNAAGTYEPRLFYQPTPKGNIFLATKAGSVKRVEDPVSVKEGDIIKRGSKNGKKYIDHEIVEPRKSNKILLVYTYIHFPDGTMEAFWLDADDMNRLSGYSAKQNSKWLNGQKVLGKANALYSSGAEGQPDEGFWKSKVINFALKNKPKKELIGSHYIPAEEEIQTEDVTHEEITTNDPVNAGPAQQWQQATPVNTPYEQATTNTAPATEPVYANAVDEEPY